MSGSNGVVVSERVHRLFRKSLNIEIASDQTDLFESGLLDSLALVELLFAIEGEFQVQLALDELDVDDFRTVERIDAFIERSRAGA
jgi:methoxymalonate biosynthesis acyl carrier protein